MRARHLIWRLGCVGAISVPLFVLPAGTSFAQQIDITPATSITPSSHVTTWVFQMAIAAAVLGVLILIGLGLGYLRFAPKFYGREEQPAAVPPGTRPPTLVRQAAAVRWTPPAAGHAASGPASPAPARASTATATAVAERPAPSARPAPTEAPAAGVAAAAASATPTAGPSGEPAVQADAVGAAEAAAPEPRPTAKSPDEIGAPPAAAPAAAAPPAPTPAAPAAASHGASAALDQETFDRVLEEQLAKGVDRRVAEGRARAAAVVAARKKSQG
ncbi:MAG: hypothetical protein E6G40_12820 [Actinobacteria bacterium]|nr:MAG: hypothetical protein E6G40_12820 [Actinomycetota bacterium]